MPAFLVSVDESIRLCQPFPVSVGESIRLCQLFLVSVGGSIRLCQPFPISVGESIRLCLRSLFRLRKAEGYASHSANRVIVHKSSDEAFALNYLKTKQAND